MDMGIHNQRIPCCFAVSCKSQGFSDVVTFIVYPSKDLKDMRFYYILKLRYVLYYLTNWKCTWIQVSKLTTVATMTGEQLTQ